MSPIGAVALPPHLLSIGVLVLNYNTWELRMRKRIRTWFHQSLRVHVQ